MGRKRVIDTDELLFDEELFEAIGEKGYSAYTAGRRCSWRLAPHRVVAQNFLKLGIVFRGKGIFVGVPRPRYWQQLWHGNDFIISRPNCVASCGAVNPCQVVTAGKVGQEQGNGLAIIGKAG
ncbi:MAG: hypothetical protein FJ121_14270 [Deltaproteobacteria bacterium]|nr:hypothetical protein [Deltaproteobacteria bacterium]